MLLTRDPLQGKEHKEGKKKERKKVKRQGQIFHANVNDKKMRTAILVADKIDFKTKAIKKDKDGHYIMIKGSIQKEDLAHQHICS